MSAAHITLPGISTDDQRLLNRLLEGLEQRRVRNLLRLSYYDSKRAIRQVGTVVPPQYYALGLVLGWTGKAVDLLGRRCNLDAFVWPDGDLDSIGGTDVWADNHLGAEANWAVTSSLKLGPSFLINTIGLDDEPKSLIHVKSASNAIGEWNPRRRSMDNLLSITARNTEGLVSGLALYLDGRTLTAEKNPLTGAWTVNEQRHQYGVPAEMLAYRADEDRPYGRSRITRSAMGYQDAATRALIRLEGHMDIYSYPEYWMLGADMSAFKNADGTMKSVWEVRMGRIKGLPDDEDAANGRADVKQFAASDPTPHLADINALAKLFARDMSLPDTAVAITDVANPTSAESYDASQYELIAEAEGATDDWSPALRRSFVRALAIQNDVAIANVPDAWKTIDAKWRDPRFQSRAAQADAGMKQLTAIPWLAETEIGLELLGLDQQQIDRALADKRRAAGSGVIDKLLAAAGNGPGSTPAA